ncbi:hypothetical protein [Sinorhizobium terangae]|uniref:Uncharacterized protein n=1 Tax=Sinorhizobium terangae TaxID=110322 RepID=A0A6N7LDS2_SINTE|nr:hypothetical protein [Sinorhizobium terangae]MBB4186304.1 hypothetical protein [Sinorhizobium terangae]MQX15912.1 hypothetical protein [Sinorhizobium terangae]WFU51057.1 hypothetical protein QA637_20850 [Sinorhizobium terangae]
MPKKIAKIAASDEGHVVSTRLLTGALATALLLSSAGSMSAKDSRLSGLPSMILGGQTAEAPTYNFEQPFVEEVKAPTITIVLDKTTLDDIKAAFGGEVRIRSAGDVAVGWLCYTFASQSAQRDVWFIANDMQAGSGAGQVVNMIAVEEVAEDQPDCDKGQFDLADWTIPVPTLGDDKASLHQRFGNAPESGLVRYAHEGASADAQISQSLVYRLKDGKIDAVAFTQIKSK